MRQNVGASSARPGAVFVHLCGRFGRFRHRRHGRGRRRGGRGCGGRCSRCRGGHGRSFRVLPGLQLGTGVDDSRCVK